MTSSYDLHSHSTRSDGLLSPAALVARAARRGVQVLALTDHDETSGLDEARAAAGVAGIRLVNAVEVSVSWKGHTLHVVGLAVDPANHELAEGLRGNRDGRNARAKRIAALLESIGIRGALEGARTYVTNPDLVSRTHFARYLVEGRHAKNMQAAFDRYLGAGRPGHIPHDWASLEDAVNWIDAAGGLAVLAHPGRYKLDEAGRTELLQTFREAGGAGIEVVTPSHLPEECSYWGKRAREFALLASAGSDFHGPAESYRDLGELPPLPVGCTPVWSQL